MAATGEESIISHRLIVDVDVAGELDSRTAFVEPDAPLPQLSQSQRAPILTGRRAASRVDHNPMSLVVEPVNKSDTLRARLCVWIVAPVCVAKRAVEIENEN